METPIDPRTVPSITLSEAELEEIWASVQRGELPADYLARHHDAVDANVFGHDAPKDKHGRRREQGRGSPGNQTRQSIDAYKKFCQHEVDFEKTLARMEKELTACEAHRAASAVKSNKPWLQGR
jgi:hypothetical protein